MKKEEIIDMYCRKCGKQIEPESKFCGYCGEPTNLMPVQNNSDNNQYANNIYNPYNSNSDFNKKERTDCMVVLVLGILSVIALVYGIYLIFNPYTKGYGFIDIFDISKTQTVVNILLVLSLTFSIIGLVKLKNISFAFVNDSYAAKIGKVLSILSITFTLIAIFPANGILQSISKDQNEKLGRFGIYTQSSQSSNIFDEPIDFEDVDMNFDDCFSGNTSVDKIFITTDHLK